MDQMRNFSRSGNDLWAPPSTVHRAAKLNQMLFFSIRGYLLNTTRAVDRRYVQAKTEILLFISAIERRPVWLVLPPRSPVETGKRWQYGRLSPCFMFFKDKHADMTAGAGVISPE